MRGAIAPLHTEIELPPTSSGMIRTNSLRSKRIIFPPAPQADHHRHHCRQPLIKLFLCIGQRGATRCCDQLIHNNRRQRNASEDRLSSGSTDSCKASADDIRTLRVTTFSSLRILLISIPPFQQTSASFNNIVHNDIRLQVVMCTAASHSCCRTGNTVRMRAS